jgi:hypothetical protein
MIALAPLTIWSREKGRLRGKPVMQHLQSSRTNFLITSESPTEMAFINAEANALFCSVLMGHLIRTSSKVAIVSENYEFDDRFRHVTRESIVQRL